MNTPISNMIRERIEELEMVSEKAHKKTWAHKLLIDCTLEELRWLFKKIEPLENWYLNSIKIQSELLEKYMPKSTLIGWGNCTTNLL